MPRKKSRRSDPLAMLGAVPLFEGLTARELRSIREAGKVVRHPAGREIVQEGATSGVAFHLILEGTVAVKVNGRTRARLGPGAHFGEIAVIDNGPRSATVEAETPVATLAIGSWALRPLLQRTPRMAYKILVDAVKRLRDTQRALTD